MRGSGLALAVAAAAFVGGFFVLRSSSRVLAAEAQLATVRRLAADAAVPVASALALRAATLDLGDTEFEVRLRRFVALARDLGEPLAAAAMQGDEAAVRSWVLAAGSTDAALSAHRTDPAAAAAVEFEQWRERFRRRDSGRP